jgi:hypothetical protein
MFPSFHPSASPTGFQQQDHYMIVCSDNNTNVVVLYSANIMTAPTRQSVAMSGVVVRIALHSSLDLLTLQADVIIKKRQATIVVALALLLLWTTNSFMMRLMLLLLRSKY